jgi:photosystem II stability/assembly factor-like uncharacterized protein
VGEAGTTLRTTDGGNTWSSQTTDMTSDDNLNSVACPSPSACVAVGTRGMILRTSNAGSP